MNKSRIEYVYVALILVTASVLILSNLGNIYLWGDEAQTALIAKTILTHGVPLGYDGTNYFSTERMVELGKGNLWRWHAWLPFYVLAGFFAVFGVGTFTARLPFALFGIGTILLTYYFGKSMWKVRRAGVLAALFLITSVPFILLVRQCRYYSPSAFFSVAALYAYFEMMNRRKYAASAFVIASFMLFHSFYVYLPALLGAVIIHAALYHRDRLRQVVLLSGAVVVINIPWMIFFSSVANAPHGETSMAVRFATLMGYFAVQIGKHVFPIWLPMVPVILGVLYRLKHGRFEKPHSETIQNLVLLVLFSVFTAMILSPIAPNTFLRYLAPLFPLSALIVAIILESAMKRLHWSTGIIVLAILALTGRMPQYLYEITHDYDGPVEGIVECLGANAGPNDVVATNHEALPIVFYTGLRVISGVTGEDYSLAKDADWVILRKYVTEEEHGITSYLVQNLDQSGYEAITIPYPDVQFENRESPEDHLFRTVEDEDMVVIWHRIKE